MLIFQCCVPASRVLAIPPTLGRAWGSIDTLVTGGHQYMIPTRFEPTADGELRLAGRGMYGPGKFPTGFEWADSSWRVRWRHQHDSYAPYFAPGPAGEEFFLWKSQINWPWYEDYPWDYLLASRVEGDSLASPDSVARVDQASYHYAAAASRTSRWAAIWDWSWDRNMHYFRFFSSDSPAGAWIESETVIPGKRDSYGIAMTAVSDSVALVAVATDEQVHWGHLKSGVWTYGGVWSVPLIDQIISSFRPVENDFWIMWGANDRKVVVNRVTRDGRKVEVDSIDAHYPPTTYQNTKNTALSQDPRRRPLASWSAYGDNGVEYLYVAWPNDSGWDVAEQVPGTPRGGGQIIARDENGDAWLAWWNYVVGGILWTHTYVTAICDTPRVGERDGKPALSWNLTEAVPESRWSVWRSADGGDFDSIGAVTAHRDTALSFADSTAPGDAVLRYRIRRESKDVRYRWNSAEAEWLPRGVQLGVVLRSRNPVESSVDLEIFGASAGDMRAELYDLQGRLVTLVRATARGTGRDALHFDLAQASTLLHSGVYVLRLRSSDGRLSRGVKLAVIR